MRMVQFTATCPEEYILVSLIRELSYTHFIVFIGKALLRQELRNVS